MDLAGKTVTEYILERRIQELTIENHRLRYASASYERLYGKQAFSDTQQVGSINMRATQICLPRVADAEVTDDGYSYRIMARHQGGLGVSMFMGKEQWALAHPNFRADMLQQVLASAAQNIAELVGKS